MSKRYVWFVAVPMVAVLAGCGGSDKDDPGSIKNTPSATASGSSSASSSAADGPSAGPSGSSTADPETSKRIAEIGRATSEQAPGALKESTQKVRSDVVDKYYSGEVSSMKWITLLALGGSFDDESLSVDSNDVFTIDIVDSRGKSLAEVSGVMRGDQIKPNDYDETSRGDDFLSEHIQQRREWATN